MSVELSKTGWIQLYTQMRSPNAFLSRLFTTKPGGFYSGKKVAIDIQRFDEDVAIVVTKCTGPNLNDIDEFTTKEFTPPAYGEAFPVDVCELLERMAGEDPYSAAYSDYTSQLMAKIAQGFMLVDDKIKRAVELQASQILQSGELKLSDADGDTVYTISFQPKTTHFPTVGTGWSDTANADPLSDIAALNSVIRADGKVDPDMLIMGEGSLKYFLANEAVQNVLDNRRIEIGAVRPELADSGATFYGYVWVGTYRMEIWTYPDTYKDPKSGLPVKYIDDNSVVVLSSRTRLDMTSARVPLPLGPDPRVAGLLPDRMSSRSAGFDVSPNIYASSNGKQIFGELESRPLLVPVQIDGFGNLTTETA